jgi:pseudouridylate synthase / pseudouridine kinase
VSLHPEKKSSLLSTKNLCRAYEKKRVYPRHGVDLATPNEQELDAIYTAAKECNYLERHEWWKVTDALGISSTGVTVQLRDLTTPDFVDRGIPQRMIQLLPFMPNILTKLGARGKQLIR